MMRRLHAYATVASVWLRQMYVMTLKELRQLANDRALLLYIIYIFTLQIVIASGEAATELDKAPWVVYDEDQSMASRDLIYRFQLPYFRLRGSVADQEAGLQTLEAGKAVMFVDIPADFEKTLLQGRAAAEVQVLVDTSNANLGYLAASYSARIAAEFGEPWRTQNLARYAIHADTLPEIKSLPRIWHNPGLDRAWFGTISELLTMMTVACILLPAAAMVREKERGTIEQLLVTPLTPLQVMLAKVAAMIIVMLTGTAVSLFGIMQPLYAVPIRGSLTLFFTLTALYAFVNAGLGLAAATYARNAAQMGLIVLLMVMPIVLLSGTWTPIESMPRWLQIIMSVSPMRYFIGIAYGILLRGAGWSTLWDSVLIMAAIGCALFALALWRYRRQFA